MFFNMDADGDFTLNTIFKELHRVCVRDWRDSDIPLYAQLVRDPRVMKYIGNGMVRDENAAEQEVRRFRQEIKDQGWSRWAVSYGVDGPLMGYVGFSKKEDGVDFGLRFLYQHWNAPYPYIASCLALEYGFENVGFDSIYAMNHVDHTHAFGFTKRIISITPRLMKNEFGAFNVFDIPRDYYLSKEIHKNREKSEIYCRRINRVIH